MGKPNLPVRNMAEEDNKKEFEKFKKTHLDGEVLNDDNLKAIEEVCGCRDPSIARLICEETHSHDYHCFNYEYPETAIVARLIEEINYLRKIRESDREKGVNY